MTHRDDQPWHAQSTEDVLQKLDTNDKGLSEKTAQTRLEQYGLNKLPDVKKKNIILRFLIHFHNVLIYILLLSAVITALMDHWIDTWVILAVVIINALIGFIQEGKAEKALEGIRSMLSLQATVLRDGKRSQVDAQKLVPGDIVLLSTGDKIPADLRLIQTNGLKVEESPLTGESSEVSKNTDLSEPNAVPGDRKNMVFSGTTVRFGTGTGVVVETGVTTEIGKINTMILEVEEISTPLIRQINRFGKKLSLLIIGISVAFFMFGYFVRDYSTSTLFLAVIGLIVAAIPEGLPAIMTITLAIGVQRMAKRNAIIRKLPSVETLGSVSVICSDKTGTLTKNEMTVKTVYTADCKYEVQGTGYEPSGQITTDGQAVDIDDRPILRRLLQSAWVCNNSEIDQDESKQWIVKGSPTEGALKVLAIKSGMESTDAKRLDMIPFSSEHKYMATLAQIDDHRYVFINGAPDRLIGFCKKQADPEGNKPIDPAFWNENIQKTASEGQRMLGSAYCEADDLNTLSSIDDLTDRLVFLGLTGLMDPPREEAVEAVKECTQAGIRVKMITGDHAVTAMAIGKQMGIGDGSHAVTGAELEQMDDEQLIESVQENDIFARTSPEHKLRLVRALQAKRKVCAMTGDGVNDAPALKQADVGIAMGIKGTEVTKDAACMVLADDNFASIVNAVEEGRTIYDNLRKAILFLLPTNGAESLVLMIGILLGITIPITPVQILWVNMVTAVTLALAISFEPMESLTMKKPPRDPDESILGKHFLWRILFVSTVIAGLTLTGFLLIKNAGHDVAVARTVAVNILVAGQLFYLYNCRKIHDFALSKGFFENKKVFIASGLLILFQLFFTYAPFMQTLFDTAPLTAAQWLLPIGAGLITFTSVELEKWFLNGRKSATD